MMLFWGCRFDAVSISETGKYRAVRPEVTAEHRKAAAVPVRGVPYAIEVDGKECLVAMHSNTFPYNVADDVRCVVGVRCCVL